MDISTYLKRMDYNPPVNANIDSLRGLQIAHLQRVPFENLDIGLKRPIRITEQAIWEKVVVNRRGGFCYELNGLLAWLLMQIGFDVNFLNARDYHVEDDTFGIDFDHLVLMVRTKPVSKRWLVDVGWGDTFTQPLDIDVTVWQEQGLRAYRLEPFKGGYQLWQRGYDGKIERQYYFDLTPHRFPAEYEAACLYHQTSPLSIFTRNRIISRLTETGRITLDNDKTIVTTHGRREEFPIQNEEEFRVLLKNHFDIALQEEKI